MQNARVYIVHLRRPRRSDPNERRSDPFYEFGSFGCTRCHSRNLMNSKHALELQGSRLAFAQGGNRGFRLILLTPPVKITQSYLSLEAIWSRQQKPFRYEVAPVLASNHMQAD